MSEIDKGSVVSDSNSVLLCARFYKTKSDHLAIKFNQQLRAFEEIGFNTYYCAIDGDSIFLYQGNNQIIKLKKCHSIHVPLLSNIILYHDLYHSYKKAITIIPKDSLLYCRQMFYLPSATSAFKSGKKKGDRIIVEIPTYVKGGIYTTEKRKIRKTLLRLMEYANKRLSKYIDLYTLIGDSSDNYNGRPAINISNGVDKTLYRLKKERQPDGTINILVLSTMSHWHGYDRLVNGFNAFYKRKRDDVNVFIHFVGGDGDGTLKKLQEYVKSSGLSDNVLFYGPLYGRELDEIFDQCDIGIASLGLHRIGLYKAAVLKIREYAVRGLPFVYATEDDMISDSFGYALRVHSDDSLIDFDEIISFYQKIYVNEGCCSRIRQYALANMTWEGQLRKVINKLENNSESKV